MYFYSYLKNNVRILCQVESCVKKTYLATLFNDEDGESIIVSDSEDEDWILGDTSPECAASNYDEFKDISDNFLCSESSSISYIRYCNLLLVINDFYTFLDNENMQVSEPDNESADEGI